MRKRWLKISVFIIIMMWVVINLNMSLCPDSGKRGTTSLKMQNLEALASPEIGIDTWPCVKAKGFCFIHQIQTFGVAFAD